MIDRYDYRHDSTLGTIFFKDETGEWCKWEDAEKERKKAYKQGYNDSVKALIKIIRELGAAVFKKLEEMSKPQ